MAKAKPKNNAAAFRSLEAKFAKLRLVGHHKTKEAATQHETRIAKVEGRLKRICDVANSAERDLGDRFILLLRKQWRSSQDFVDYCQQRDRLLVRLGEVAAEEHKQASEEGRRKRAALIFDRNREMAREFLNKKRIHIHIEAILF
jgi:hypothetical protein